jgi:hypothetical protein
MHNDPKPSCFVISPIGDKDTPTRKHADQALKYIFKKALSAEYHVIRADKISQPGMITSQILQAVQDSPLVLADLSEHNPNVFYELAVRHAVEKPIIHVIDTRWTIPFDVGNFRTIKYDLADPDSVHNAVRELKDQAEQVRADNWGETPIKLANIMRRTAEDTPQMLLLKEALEGISNIAARLTSVEGSVRAIDSPQVLWHTENIAGPRAGFGTGMLTFDNAADLAARAVIVDSGASEFSHPRGTGIMELIQPPGASRRRKFAYAPRSTRGGVVQAASKLDSKKKH